jgi:hypothetical protein
MIVCQGSQGRGWGRGEADEEVNMIKGHYTYMYENNIMKPTTN